jgi:hypothetical protein
MKYEDEMREELKGSLGSCGQSLGSAMRSLNTALEMIERENSGHEQSDTSLKPLKNALNLVWQSKCLIWLRQLPVWNYSCRKMFIYRFRRVRFGIHFDILEPFNYSTQPVVVSRQNSKETDRHASNIEH